jgi:Synergist-CTERM protein sorting domain-containing protein
MKKFLLLAVFLSLFVGITFALADMEVLIPEDPDPADWIVFEFPDNCDEPLPSEGIGAVADCGTVLNLVISGDDEVYVSGDRAVTRIGPKLSGEDDDDSGYGLLFLRLTGNSATMTVNYVNTTDDELDASELVFAGGASLQGVIPASSTGSTNFTISAPRRGAFPMILEEDLITPSDSSDYAYPHGLMTILRVNETPTLKVSYNPHGGNIPYGVPASNYPLIRKDLLPYRFLSGTGDLQVDLGTVFVTGDHRWPGAGNSELPAFETYNGTPWDESDYAQKSKALMVRVENWGNETIDLDLAPLHTGFESFYIVHNRLSCGENHGDTGGSGWPNWAWYDVLGSGIFGGDRGNFLEVFPGLTSADLQDPGTEYSWPLVPGMTAMYWGGVLDPGLKDLEPADSYEWPLDRIYDTDGVNTHTLQVGDQSVTIEWTPKMFDILGMLYPYIEGAQDGLWYDRWDPCSYVPETPAEYQGSGLVVQMVDFDLEGLSLWKPGKEQIDAANASIGWNAGEGTIELEALVPLKIGSSAIGTQFEGAPALPLHLFAYTTDPLLAGLNETAWDQVKTAVNSDTPLDSAFLSHAEFTYKGTDLVSLAGDDRTNFFRVLGDTGRVITHFFVVVVDGPAPSGEAAVQKKDGYFLLYDGVADDQFDASMTASTEETGDGGSSGCSAAGLAPLGLFLLVPLFLLRRR